MNDMTVLSSMLALVAIGAASIAVCMGILRDDDDEWEQLTLAIDAARADW